MNGVCVEDLYDNKPNVKCDTPIDGFSVNEMGECVPDCDDTEKPGFPLNTPGYHKVGTACIADSVPDPKSVVNR